MHGAETNKSHPMCGVPAEVEQDDTRPVLAVTLSTGVVFTVYSGRGFHIFVFCVGDVVLVPGVLSRVPKGRKAGTGLRRTGGC